jgi:hypothetical protein
VGSGKQKIVDRGSLSTMKFLSAYRYRLFLFVLPLVVVEASKHHDETKEGSECSCKLYPRPDKAEKAKTARWMIHSMSWGTLATISTRIGNATSPVPFGNTISFVDGPCSEATGIPYFYGTYLDQSFTDTLQNPTVSLSLSEASLSSVCSNRDGLEACQLSTKYGDPENPVCARVTVTGTFEVLEATSHEYQYALEAVFHRHTSMEGWPTNHNWVIGKINIQDVWLIDFFGGAAIMSADEYFAANLDDEQQDE